MQPVHHLNPNGDMSLSCALLLLCSNMLNCNVVLNWAQSFSFMQWLQIIAMLASIIASCYVARNQHKTLRWKKRREADEFNQKKNGDNE